METTKPVLSSSRSASASSERHDGNTNSGTSNTAQSHVQTDTGGPAKGLWMKRLLKPVSEHVTERRSSVVSSKATPEPGENQQLPSMSMKAVLHSLNRINAFRDRSKIMRGNVTRDTPLRKFQPNAVKEEMDRILATALKDVKYEPKRASVLATGLSDSIKGKVKTMKFPRYKFIVSVTISSKSDQSMTVASRCLWNCSSDSYATSYFSNDSIAAVAVLFAILYE